MAKQLGHRVDSSLRQAVKAPVGSKQAVGYEHVEMGMEDEVIAKSMNLKRKMGVFFEPHWLRSLIFHFVRR
jgi:hypothetical protein